MKHLLRIALLVLLIQSQTYCQTELDTSFNGDGYVTDDFSSPEDVTQPHDIGISIKVQTDGKYLVGGNAGGSLSFAFVRYNPDGSQDTSFGDGGKVRFEFDGSSSSAFLSAMEILPGGKIIAAGSVVTSTTANIDFGIVRFNPDGSVDSSFGDNGTVITDFFGGEDSISTGAMAIQNDGKIVVAGAATNSSGLYDFAITRYMPDGNLDTSFGDGGKVIMSFQTAGAIARTVSILDDGKIIIAGITSDFSQTQVAMAKLNDDGSLDTSFGVNGKATISNIVGLINIGTLDFQSDGKMILGGQSIEAAFFQLLLRVNADGTLDTTFGSGGIHTHDSPGANGNIRKIRIDDNDNIIAIGVEDAGMYITRRLPNGDFDTSFNATGFAIINPGTGLTNSTELGHDLIILNENSYLTTGGDYVNATNFTDFVTMRIIPDASLGVVDLSVISDQLLVYPNPVEDLVTLEFTLLSDEKNLNLDIFDLGGRHIKSIFRNKHTVTGNHKMTISLGDMSSGNYIITLSNNQSKRSLKIIKE